MAQKLLLFWRKPARRCWWEGVDLDNVEGVEGQVKVWIRRVWTLEMVSYIISPLYTLVYNFFLERDRTSMINSQCVFAPAFVSIPRSWSSASTFVVSPS